VDDDRHAVAGQANVELPGVCPAGVRSFGCHERVFRRDGRRASMRDDEGPTGRRSNRLEKEVARLALPAFAAPVVVRLTHLRPRFLVVFRMVSASGTRPFTTLGLV
jgi:hypothetical protein